MGMDTRTGISWRAATLAAALLCALPATAQSASNDRWQAATVMRGERLVTSVDARTATADPGEPAPSCTSNAQLPNGVWYRVRAPRRGSILRVAVRGQAAGSVTAVFAVAPNVGTELSCSSAEADAIQGFEHVLIAGMTYYVLVGTKPGGPVRGDVLDVQLDIRRTGWGGVLPLPARRQGVQAVGHGAAVFAIGGLQTSYRQGAEPAFHSSSVERWDARRGRWRTVGTLPIGMSYGQAIRLGRKVHLPGGQTNPVNGANCAVPTHLVYDLRTQRTESATAVSGPATWDYAGAADERNGLVYLAGGAWDPTPCDVGGRNDQQVTGRIRAWHPKSGRWFELTPLVEPRRGATAQVVGGKLLVMGGLRGSTASAVVERYDPGTGRVAQLAPMPLPVYAPASGLGQGPDGRPLVYVTGGWTHAAGGADTGATQVYDVRADRWRLLASRMTPRDAVGGAVAGGYLYAVAGHGPQPIRAVDRLKIDAAPPAVRLVRSGSTTVARATDPAGIVSIEWRVGRRLVARGARASSSVVRGGRVTVRDAAGNVRTVAV